VGGKFFRRGAEKFYPKGVTYGPFAPNRRREMYPEPDQAEQDFRQIRELGANLIRVYDVPPGWLLDAAQRHGLQVLVDIPWSHHLCFLDSAPLRKNARSAVRAAVESCAGHPAVFAYSVANEISAEIVRWSGAARVEAFIDELVAVAKSADRDCLCTFTSYPSTEYLRSDVVDFVSFNVYLHDQAAFESYLARLQMLADVKPLLLTELGMDSLREGERRKCEFLSGHIGAAFCRGLAGAVVFSYTDDWFRGGEQIRDWAFGLTTAGREAKPSFSAVQRAFAAAPHAKLARYPRISVVVASYNGAATLRACLESLTRLQYPDYEAILVDDGSTDNTPEIAAQFPSIRAVRQQNQGLSAARNAGIRLATGEIVAFTDSDCRVDQDWLYYLVCDLLDGPFVAVGGHNLLPEEDSAVAAAVLVSPGGPTHVMLTDREAEHIPGCNMAFYRWALDEIGGFDPIFHAAGDDVDVCWRLQQRGYRIGFSPAAFVWHFRRSTVRAYLEQQSGYGEAEALLLRKHPAYFNALGRSVWCGRIYSASSLGVVLGRPAIYHGLFGTGLFQRLYSPRPSYGLLLCISLEYHILVTGPLLLLALAFPWLWPLPCTSVACSVGVCALAAAQAHLPRRKRRVWSRPLVGLLFFLQPIERGLSRYRTLLRFAPSSRAPVESVAGSRALGPVEDLCYWSNGSVDRLTFLKAMLDRLTRSNWRVRIDTGWSPHDLEIAESRWSRLRLVTTTELLEGGRMNFRCRLWTSWSFQAKVLFWALCAFELVLVLLIAPFQPWIWMLLLTQPILVWYLQYDQAQLRHATAALLDEVALEQNLSTLGKEAAVP
jgi:GT2 family glycosyltransferase